MPPSFLLSPESFFPFLSSKRPVTTHCSPAKDLLHQVDPDNNGKVSFEEFLQILSLGREERETVSAGDDPTDTKVLEFLNILNEYRIKCEEEGKYLEAERAAKQLSALQKQVQ